MPSFKILTPSISPKTYQDFVGEWHRATHTIPRFVCLCVCYLTVAHCKIARFVLVDHQCTNELSSHAYGIILLIIWYMHN